MKHPDDLIERVARAMYDRAVLRGADRDIPMMYHDLAQAALAAAGIKRLQDKVRDLAHNMRTLEEARLRVEDEKARLREALEKIVDDVTAPEGYVAVAIAEEALKETDDAEKERKDTDGL